MLGLLFASVGPLRPGVYRRLLILLGRRRFRDDLSFAQFSKPCYSCLYSLSGASYHLDLYTIYWITAASWSQLLMSQLDYRWRCFDFVAIPALPRPLRRSSHASAIYLPRGLLRISLPAQSLPPAGLATPGRVERRATESSSASLPSGDVASACLAPPRPTGRVGGIHLHSAACR